MMEGPHILGFSPAAFCNNLTRALASERRLWSVIASINADTLNLVGLVLLSAMLPFLLSRHLVAYARPSLLPLQEIRHRLDIQIRLIYERHVPGLRHDCQF